MVSQFIYFFNIFSEYIRITREIMVDFIIKLFDLKI